MSDIEKLLAKSKKIDLDGVEVEVHSLTVSDFGELSKLGERDVNIKSQAIKDLIERSLKKSFPGATDDQIKNIGIKYIGKYVDALFEVSGLDIDKKKLDEMTASLA